MTWMETDRLILRDFQAGDAADLFAYLRQPHRRKTVGAGLAQIGEQVGGVARLKVPQDQTIRLNPCHPSSPVRPAPS